MLFHSTYKPNLERQQTKVEICWFSIEYYETTSYGELHKSINRVAKQHKISLEDIKFYRQNVEVEELKYEERMILFYERPETDKEYNSRIRSLKSRDIREFANVLASYHSSKAEKPLIKRYLEEKVYILPDWQKKMVENFLAGKL